MRSNLEKGTNIQKYTVIAVLGEGASCVAYSCVDSTGRKVVVKEYNPISVNTWRDSKYNLHFADKDAERFKNGLATFRESVQRQIDIRSGCAINADLIVNQVFDVSDQFDEYGTYYYVMPEFFGNVYSKNRDITLYNRIRICRSIAQYVQVCHASGYLCLDIKPDNIYVIPESPDFPMFFDYDSLVRKEDIRSGYLLSCSDHWAAPEQLIPEEYEKICEATDIYALGELIFWSVFGRNSYGEEHRSFSEFPFDESSFSQNLNYESRNKLTEIFHNSIRSLPRMRYQDVAKLLIQIDELLSDLDPQTIHLVNMLPRENTHFCGRGDELDKLENILNETHLAILYGLGGIGKSEIAKRFALSHKYKTVLCFTYQSNLIDTVNSTYFVSNLIQGEKETNEHFCERKLNALANLCDYSTLLIIDNLNTEIEHIECQDVWGRISKMPCDLLITTRCAQNQYIGNQIHIKEMQTEYLEAAFYAIFHYDDTQRDSVRELILRYHSHTLIVLWIAKLCRSLFMNPSEVLSNLCLSGFASRQKTQLSLHCCDNPLITYINELFPLLNVSDKQKELLFCITLMPDSYFSVNEFLLLFDAYERKDFRELEDRGWISEVEPGSGNVSIHPVVAEAVRSQYSLGKDATRNLFLQISKAVAKRLPLTDLISVKEMMDVIFEKSKSLNVDTEAYADSIVLYYLRMHPFVNSYKAQVFLLQAIEMYEKIYQGEYAVCKEVATVCLIQEYIETNRFKEAEILSQEHANLSVRNNVLLYGGVYEFFYVYINLSMMAIPERLRKKLIRLCVILLSPLSLFCYAPGGIYEYIKFCQMKKGKNLRSLSRLHVDYERLRLWIDTKESYANDAKSESPFYHEFDYADISKWYAITPREARRRAYISVIRVWAEVLDSYKFEKSYKLYRNAAQQLCRGKYRIARKSLSEYLSCCNLTPYNGKNRIAVHRALGEVDTIQKDYKSAIIQFKKMFKDRNADKWRIKF